MNKEKERQNCYRMWKAINDYAGEPEKMYLLGKDTGYEVLIAYYKTRVITAQIHVLSGYEYVHMKDEEINE